MLKKFFTVFLGSMAAIWLSIILMGMILLIGVIAWLARHNDDVIEDHSILYLDLSGTITDREQDITAETILLGDLNQNKSFEDMLFSIERATDDDRIESIYMNLGDASMSMAMREELMNALRKFKEKGKKIYAYSDSFTQGDYYMASIADQITLNPAGYFDMRGLSLSVVFFKEALDKLGVEVQVLKVGTFKSAVEPFLLTSMSEPNRLQYTELLQSIWRDYTGTLAANLSSRGFNYTTSQLDSLATDLSLFRMSGSELVDAGFITTSGYRNDSEMLLRRSGEDYEQLQKRFVSPTKYINSTTSLSDNRDLDGKKPHIALVYAVGDIVDTGSGGIVGDRMAPMIYKMAEDDNVKGIVMRVNSGGGSAFASEQIWAALEYFKSKGKPFYVSMGGAAASGGYYISAGADYIYADRSTLTGSIGIFGIIPYAKELLNDKLGITFSTVSTNPNAAFPQLAEPLTERQHEALENHIRKGYDLFVSRVAAGRNMTTDEVEAIAEGRVWTGAKALEIGLVDEIGGLSDALNAMAKKVNLDRNSVLSYPLRSRTPWQMIISEMNSLNVPVDVYQDIPQSTLQSLAATLGLTIEQVRQGMNILNRIRSMSETQAKMEDIVIQ